MKNLANNSLSALRTYISEGLNERYDEREAKSIAQILICELLGMAKHELILNGDKSISESEILKLHFALKRLKKGEPLQHILGVQEFYGLNIRVNENTLIPRPETEELVHWIKEEEQGSSRVLDVGTGSGCIALAIKSIFAQAEIEGVDISEKALEIAKINAEELKLEVRWKRMDILSEELTKTKYDVIVSNPPYITPSEKEEMRDEVLDFEPENALFVPQDDPLLFYRRVAELGLKSLKPSGSIYFEINPLFVAELRQLLTDMAYKVVVKEDMQGRKRMMKASFL